MKIGFKSDSDYSFRGQSHSVVPGRGNKPVCYRGVVEGGEYAIRNGTGIVDIAFRLQVWP